jgi:uncharacterized protein
MQMPVVETAGRVARRARFEKWETWMKVRLVNEIGERTFVVVFDAGEEVVAGLTGFAKLSGLPAASFTAIGAFSDVTLGFFDYESKKYKEIPVNDQVELLSLVGNVVLYEGEPKLHAHVVVGKRDGTAYGGHLLKAHVRPTLEVVAVELPESLQRKIDKDTGLPLIKL